LISLPVRIIEDFPREPQDQGGARSETIGSHTTRRREVSDRPEFASLFPPAHPRGLRSAAATPIVTTHDTLGQSGRRCNRPNPVLVTREFTPGGQGATPRGSAKGRSSIVAQIEPRAVLQKITRCRLTHAATGETE